MALRQEGIGASVKHAAVISLTDENFMWEKGILGTSAPRPLLRAVFYKVGLFFSLRGSQEHRDFIVSQLSRVPSSGYDAGTH